MMERWQRKRVKELGMRKFCEIHEGLEKGYFAEDADRIQFILHEYKISQQQGKFDAKSITRAGRRWHSSLALTTRDRQKLNDFMFIHVRRQATKSEQCIYSKLVYRKIVGPRTSTRLSALLGCLCVCRRILGTEMAFLARAAQFLRMSANTSLALRIIPRTMSSAARADSN